MEKTPPLLLLYGFLFILSLGWGISGAAADRPSPRLWGADRCDAGEAVMLFLSSATDLQEVSVTLVPAVQPESPPDSGADSLVKKGHPADGYTPEVLPPRVFSRTTLHPWSSGGPSLQLGLLGVPAQVEPGVYRLIVRGIRDNSPWYLVRPFIVEAHPRDRLDLRLNRKMTTIIRQPDPRKKEQARRLWEILGQVNPGAFHQEGVFIKPVDSDRITSTFGQIRRYIYPDGVQYESRHNGIDYAAPEGTPVLACGRGRVALAEDRIVTGNSVVLEHLPGVYTLYYHLHTLAVTPGQRVEPGDLLGTVGTTGFSTGDHLHWEMRILGTSVDPSLFLERPVIDKSVIPGIMGSTETKGR